MKEQEFFESDWDVAIILDSARYDVFKDVYSKYFTGDLEKRDSGASATPEWIQRTFQTRYNVTWFSANPYINGKNIRLNEFDYMPQKYDKNPTKYLTEIVDVWDISWDKEKGTVKPEKLNEEYIERKDRLADRRVVLHYMQPHKPFLHQGGNRIENFKIKSIERMDEESRNYLPKNFKDKIEYLASKLEKSETAMKIGFMTALDPVSFAKAIFGDTSEELRGHHRKNLEIALENVRDVVEEVEGKVIITSDHGEAFGERGVWEHHIERDIPALREVPWLEVDETRYPDKS